MAQSSESQKRPLPPKVAAMKARKRRKLEGKDPAVPLTKSKPANVRKTGLKADTLQWKEVSMPDHLDDYEGFFGLEEVDDIEVVRDAETGRVSFNSKSAVESADVEAESTVDGDEEWSGFEEEIVASASELPPTAASQRPEKTPKTPEPSEPAGTTPVANGTSFRTLTSQGDNESAASDISAWRSLNLSPDTLASLSKLGFSKPTPIQQSAIPEILNGHDVIGKASTGSGKTLAFGIPILEHYLEVRNTRKTSRDKSPLALILSPTRELAHQLDRHIFELCTTGIFEGPAIATLTGGLSIQKQLRLLKNADIVIGTPGRLWEVLSEGQGLMESLKGIKFLVVDEADRLLSQGNFKEAEEIFNALDRRNEDENESTSTKQITERQTLVFSATFDRNLQRKLASKPNKSTSGNNLLSNQESMEYLISKLNFREETPKFVDVNPISHLATGLKESLIECPAGTDKDLYLYTLLLLLSSARQSPRTLVFANSITAVKRLTPFLQNLNLPALALHSSMPQKARLRSVERFTSGQGQQACSILVATDVAARGLDIPDVQVVLHYHLPRAADTYVHRSGRTARAGQPGSSILICAPEEVAGVRRLVVKVHTSNSDSEETRQGRYIRTLDLNRRIVSRLKPRATLAKKLADVGLAKDKQSKEDEFMRNAAEELGVDYDSESFEVDAAKGRRGRGAGRKKKEKEASGRSKAEVAALKAELQGLLKQRVNVGVSERYLTSGGVDVDELLRQNDGMAEKANKGREFLGSVHDLGLEDL